LIVAREACGKQSSERLERFVMQIYFFLFLQFYHTARNKVSTFSLELLFVLTHNAQALRSGEAVFAAVPGSAINR
jgi:hypothetical protein